MLGVDDALLLAAGILLGVNGLHSGLFCCKDVKLITEIPGYPPIEMVTPASICEDVAKLQRKEHPEWKVYCR